MSKDKTAKDIVALARAADRPTSRDHIAEIFDEFIECHGDRYFSDDKAVVGGIASLAGRPVTVIGIQKGRDLEENIESNFGSPNPEGYRKALRLMKQAEKFKRPVITFINTPGAYCGTGAEERGEGEAIARNLMAMSHLKVPIVSIFTGEGGSGGALALAVADEVWMLEYSIYSILSPEGFASILWKDSSRSDEAAEVMKLTSYDLKKLGVVEKIIYETQDNKTIPRFLIHQEIRSQLIETIDQLCGLSVEELLAKRYQRFRKF
ncbi:acetyl-CoA carboxylase carboxyltransferase subunit alpha [Vagococcus acidifermentans]|uniref:acetyl-CoA carboxylase carboxyltransferase subunit alpha n=1 Tax=Vagococcus acidifermentans TaxID=564710 RepID=UPI001FEA31DB|nr:acetyl-CoA carboxylase carboxyltransferase subunit alpha [Vagococcus acidifermentans]